MLPPWHMADVPLRALHVFIAGKQQVVYGHRDFEYMLPGNIRASFIWAPYAANLTTMYTNWYAQPTTATGRLSRALLAISPDQERALQ